MAAIKKDDAKKGADYEAIGEKIRAAVQAGKITKEEGRAKMAAIKKDQGSDRAKDYLAKVKKELGAALEAGRISKEDAAKRYEAAEKAIRERMAMAERGERERGERSITVEEYRRAEAKMRKMVEDGKAKPEDVERRLIEMRKMIAGRSERGAREDVDWEGIKKRIEGAVKSGKMTREEADAQYKEIRKRMAGEGKGDSKRISHEEYRKAEGEIHKAIAAGKLTKEQGRERLAAMRKMIGEKSVAPAKKKSRPGEAREDVDWEAIKRRIEGAVKSGKMTREEADAQYAEIKKRMAGEGKGDSKRIGREDYGKAARDIREAVAAGKLTKEQGREKLAAIRKQIGEKSEAPAKKKSREGQAKKDVDWEAVKKKIEGAVKSGKITREEADAKYEAIKKQMAGGDKR